MLIVFDSNTGVLKAVIEAFALGQMRTGGASGVATRWLAAEQADELAIVGTGKQSLSQVAAVVAVRPIRRVRVFGRDAGRRSQLANRIRKEFSVEVVEASDVAQPRVEVDRVIRQAERKDVRLARPVPLHWVYVTGWASADGVVQFRDDIYGRDGLTSAASAG